MIPILFLDIDGPLVNRRVHMSKYDHNTLVGASSVMDDHDPVVANLIKRLCASLGVKIVFCSTWRLWRDQCENIIESMGLDWVTNVHEDWRTNDRNLTIDAGGRGEEIDQWLRRHPEVKVWAALDDEATTYRPHQLLRLVKCDSTDGVNYQHQCDLWNLLSGNKNAKPKK